MPLEQTLLNHMPSILHVHAQLTIPQIPPFLPHAKNPCESNTPTITSAVSTFDWGQYQNRADMLVSL